MNIQTLKSCCSTEYLHDVRLEDFHTRTPQEFRASLRRISRSKLIYLTNFTSMGMRYRMWRVGFRKVGSYPGRNGGKVLVMYHPNKRY